MSEGVGVKGDGGMGQGARREEKGKEMVGRAGGEEEGEGKEIE